MSLMLVADLNRKRHADHPPSLGGKSLRLDVSTLAKSSRHLPQHPPASRLGQAPLSWRQRHHFFLFADHLLLANIDHILEIWAAHAVNAAERRPRRVGRNGAIVPRHSQATQYVAPRRASILHTGLRRGVRGSKEAATDLAGRSRRLRQFVVGIRVGFCRSRSGS
ncbi:hypothetical protein BKA80DRAFT_278803 [Phyllosticta citrichinensis]